MVVRDSRGEVLFESGGFASDGTIVGNDNDLDATRFEPHHAEIERPEWQRRWRDKRLRDEAGRVRIRVVRAAPDADSPEAAFEVQGIAGATRTGDGVGELVRFWVGPSGFGPYLARLREGGEG